MLTEGWAHTRPQESNPNTLRPLRRLKRLIIYHGTQFRGTVSFVLYPFIRRGTLQGREKKNFRVP